MLAHCRVTLASSIKFVDIHLIYTWVEGGTVRVKCLPKNATKCPQPGLVPGLLVVEWSTLIMRPLCLPLVSVTFA